MNSLMRISTVVALLSGALMMHTADAQLHGNWPNDPRWQNSEHAAQPSAQRVNNRQSDNTLGIPRGDLRKDVSDASREQPVRRPR